MLFLHVSQFSTTLCQQNFLITHFFLPPLILFYFYNLSFFILFLSWFYLLHMFIFIESWLILNFKKLILSTYLWSVYVGTQNNTLWRNTWDIKKRRRRSREHKNEEEEAKKRRSYQLWGGGFLQETNDVLVTAATGSFHSAKIV